MRLATSILVAAVLAAPVPALSAEMTAEELLDAYEHGDDDTRTLLDIVVQNTQNGMAWSNSMLATERRIERLYCVPSSATFTGQRLVRFIERMVDKEPDLVDKPYGMVLLLTMMDRYPC